MINYTIDILKMLIELLEKNSSYTDGEILFIKHLDTEIEKFITILKSKGNNNDKNN